MMQLAQPAEQIADSRDEPDDAIQPKADLVPGTRNHVSSSCDSMSRFSSRNARPRRPAAAAHARRAESPACRRSAMRRIARSALARFYIRWMLQSDVDTAAIVQWQNAALWQRMSWVRTPLAAPITLPLRQPRLSSARARVPVAAPCSPKSNAARRRRQLAPPIAPATISSPEPPAGPTPPGSPASTRPSVPARALSRTSTPPSSTRSRSTTPSALCPPPSSFEGWLAATPPASASASKPRSASPTSSACATATPPSPQFVAALEPVRAAGKLGLLLFQLPPNFKADPARLAAFLARPALAPTPPAASPSSSATQSWFTDDDLRPPPPPQRRPLHRRKRRPRHPRGPHRRTSRCYPPPPQRRLHARRARRLRHPLHRTRQRRATSTSTSSTRTNPPARSTPPPCCASASPRPARRADDRQTPSPHADPADVHRTFHPRRLLSNGHLQTIVGNFLPRHDTLPRPQSRSSSKSPPRTARQIASQVLCHCHWQPLPSVRAARPTVIILHGLEGSSQLAVRRRQRQQALARRLQRHPHEHAQLRRHRAPHPHALPLRPLRRRRSPSCASSSTREQLAVHRPHRLLHGRQPRPQARRRPRPERPAAAPLASSASLPRSISPPPPTPSTTRTTASTSGKFLRALLKRFRRKAMLFPRAFDPQRAAGIRSLRDFDDRITALYSGFTLRRRLLLPRRRRPRPRPHRRPHAHPPRLDDPFVRLTPETRASIAANPNITFLETAHGGHCAFLATPDPANGNDGYWAEHTALRFLLAHT